MLKKIFKWIGILFIVLIVIAGYLFYELKKHHKKLASGTIISQTVIDTIPFTYAATGHMLIQVKVENSEKSYPFILDSGASNFIFSHKSDELALKDNGKSIIQGATGHFIFTDIKQIDSLQIGEFKFQGLNAKEVDFNFDCSSDIYGMIGTGVMHHLTWQIDFENQNIILTKDPSKLTYQENKIIIPLNLNKSTNHLRARLQLPGHPKSIKTIVDLGNSGTLLMEEDYIVSNPTALKKKLISGKASVGLGGSVKEKDSEKIYLFDSLIFKSAKVGFNDMPVNTSPSAINLLGLGFLKKFKTTLNWEDQTMTLEPYDSTQQFLWKTTGIYTKFDKTDNKVIIKALIKNTSADLAGITPNTEVHAINDFKFTDEQSYCDFKNATISGDTIHYHLKSGEEIKSYALVKKSLFPPSN